MIGLGLGLGLTRGGAWSLQNLFAAGEVGGVIDLSPVYPHQQLFQDTAGLQPVTAPGQTVALAKMRPVGIEFSQASASLRPTYAVRPKGGRNNLLLASDTLATQSVTVGAVPHILHFTGTGTVTLSGASTAGPLVGSGVDTRVSLTFTPTAGSLTLTVTGSVTLAQLQIGSTVTPYQRVITAFDVYEAGKTHYGALWFDGVDDFMVSGTVTPGTDKVQVFMGIRKNSDAEQGAVLESSITTLSNAGTFIVFAPSSALNNYTFRSKGTSNADISMSGYTAPHRAVIVADGDIPADVASIRVNGSTAVVSTTNQGTGGFLAYPIYMGRRGGISSPFSGEIEGYVGFRFGPNLSDAQLAQIAATINAKTGAYT